MKRRSATVIKQSTPAQDALSGLWLSPLVVAARMPVLMVEAMQPNPSKRVETNRMVQEKLSAAQEGIIAAQVAFGQACLENWAAFAFGQPPKSTMRKTANAMMEASLAPAARKVKANVRRLTSR
jgi:hypothetical protein